MIIEDQEAFKTWLTAVLKPICDADPSALAKYIIALVKKDKSPEALQESMVSQLEVFLQSQTEPFVQLLFKTLESQDYITPVIPNANPPNPNIVKAEITSPKITKEVKPIIPVSELPNLSEAINGSSSKKEKEKELEVKRDREIKKSDSEKEDKPRRRSRHRSLSRNRSRSRSWDRSRRSRSREKSRDRDQHRVEREKRDRVRIWRNKSPPRRYERRRSRSGSAGARLRSRSRSPRHSHRGRYRNRSPPRSTSRSRSRSNDRKDRKDKSDKDVKDNHSRAGTPTQDSNHGDMDLRLTNTTQSIQSVVAQQNSGDSRGGVKRRCRDYDEKGFCMRGEMCPFDHGADPVVLEDTALTKVLSYPPNGAPIMDVPPPILAPPIIGAAGHPMIHPMNPRPLPPEYNPQAPQMWHRPGFRGPRPILGPRAPQMGLFPPQPNVQRELISVPVMDNQQGEQFPQNFARQPFIPHDHDNDFKKKSFDFNRLGPRMKNPANCSLELKKVPTGLNNITHLNNHFAKFGKIVNIQVSYEGDPEAAIVTFSSHAEANAAYRSTEAVLNNRFIKVFWHSPNLDGKQENVPPRSVKDRLGLQPSVPPNTNKVLNLVQPKADNNEDNTNNNISGAKDVKKEEIKAQQAAAIKKGQELLAAKERLKKNHEEQRKEAIKLTQNLRKRKQELLEKQLAQQKLLIEKMEKTPAGPQREVLLQTIKKSQESIEAIRNDMLQQPAIPPKPAPHKKTKEEAQKEMLDAELDLITKQAEGADTSEIQKKIMELRKSTMMTRGRGRGTRRYNPIVSRHLLSKNNLIDNTAVPKGNVKSVNSPNKNVFHKHAVDHRPTRLLVSGYESDEQESVITHFSQFGEIVDYVSDAATPSIVFNYKSRKEAEVALQKGKNFQDRTLTITWCNNAQLNTQLSGRSSSRTVLMSESEEEQLVESSMLEGDEEIGNEISEEVLLQDDEEEEDEGEDRSWRR